MSRSNSGLHADVGLTRSPRAPLGTRHHRLRASSWRKVPTTYLIAENNIQVTFTPNTPGPPIAGLAWQESGPVSRTANGFATRILAGDDRCSDTTSRISSPWGQSAAVCASRSASKHSESQAVTVTNSLRGGLARAIAASKPQPKPGCCGMYVEVPVSA